MSTCSVGWYLYHFIINGINDQSYKFERMVTLIFQLFLKYLPKFNLIVIFSIFKSLKSTVMAFSFKQYTYTYLVFCITDMPDHIFETLNTHRLNLLTVISQLSMIQWGNITGYYRKSKILILFHLNFHGSHYLYWKNIVKLYTLIKNNIEVYILI